MKRLAVVAGAVLVAAALAVTAVTLASDGGTTIDHDGENVTLAAAPGQAVSGQTDLDAGTTLDVRLTSTDASNPFLQTKEATVAENGSFSTTLNLGGVAAGATGNLTVRHNDSVLASETVAVVPCDDDCEAATETDEPQSGTTVDHDGERLTLVSGTASKISGQSDLEPGTELELTLESTDATSPFLLRERTNVTENGSFAVTMDTSFVSETANATLTVSHDDEELTEAEARIEPCEENCESSSAGEGTPPSEFGLEEDVPVAQENGTAEIAVAVGDADAATLSVGDEDDVNYQINATARDENGDGRVVFVLDPTAAGNESAPTMMVRDDGDSVTITSETDVDGPLSPATYDLAVYRGSSADGGPDDIGALSIQRS
ncbi:hypothetical protein SAMN05216559_0950 [Halomicrobium zhouii]|uniref:DUF7827 domain-containing protein n=1 Tax=Halomicrobium zhouii TaxID=767519 RepID=A0A1I6KKT0_9EURY|nr:BGTF surface domain-containing protein [Halomicrobium zhouii]SFR91648.1 hypothetical protein SAMN05216559_0950 [Halomicrobium zhouii]